MGNVHQAWMQHLWGLVGTEAGLPQNSPEHRVAAGKHRQWSLMLPCQWYMVGVWCGNSPENPNTHKLTDKEAQETWLLTIQELPEVHPKLTNGPPFPSQCRRHTCPPRSPSNGPLRQCPGGTSTSKSPSHNHSAFSLPKQWGTCSPTQGNLHKANPTRLGLGERALSTNS